MKEQIQQHIDSSSNNDIDRESKPTAQNYRFLRATTTRYGDIFYLEGAGVFVCDLDTLEDMFGREEFSGRLDINLAFNVISIFSKDL